MNKIALSKETLAHMEKGTVRLDIGCGDQKHQRAGHNLRMDAVDFGQEVVWDINEGVPLPDNSCEHITSSHFFEHLMPGMPTLKAYNECWRILKPGGVLYVIVPSVHKPNVRIPIHTMLYDEHTFRFFQGEETTDTSWATTRRSYNDVRLWEILELITNDRGDIHCKMTPKDK